MNPIQFALRRPITILAIISAVAVGGVLAWSRMKVDIFPSLNLPVIYVCQPYGGMDPAQMEGLITYYYEYHFLYISGIHHVESKNIQGVALMKLYFHPGTDMAQAMAETITYVNRSRAFMPPGTVPPFVMRYDTGSVPVGYLVLSSETKTIGEIQDQALNRVRPMFAAIPGVSAPPPFGGSIRSIVVRADPDRLRAYHLSPDDLVRAINAGNTISPSGAIRIGAQMPIVPVNSMVNQPRELGKIAVPLANGKSVFVEDVTMRDPLTLEPLIEDATDIPTGYALINGKRAVYILVTKRAEASTVEVVDRVKTELPKMQNALPSDIKVSFEFDQSSFVTNSMRGVRNEAIFGAALIGLTVLVFLRDWRSVLVVVLNIPLALLAAMLALWLNGQTINLMTLGGLALAVGILVDESTVAVENIHTQLEHTDSVGIGVRRGITETAVPRLLAMLCIVAVFLPSFLMQGAARSLFVPLSLAVAFAMIASYLLSSTFVPVMAVWLLRRKNAPHRAVVRGGLGRYLWLSAGTRLSGGLRWLVLPIYLLATASIIVAVGSRIGLELFPHVDSGQFQLRLRAPAGTRIEQSEEITREALRFIEQEAGDGNVKLSLGYVGVVPPSFPINAVYHWSGGPEEVVLRVALREGSGIRTERFKAGLRGRLSDHLKQWLAAKWTNEGIPAAQASQRAQNLRLSFEPADIINEVMSFGAPTPVEVAVSGPKLEDNRAFAEKIRRELAKVPSLRDLQISQTFDYPTVQVTINREKAKDFGVTAEDISRSLLAATSSSRFVVPNYWRDPGTGISFQVQVEIPQQRMNSAAEVSALPVKKSPNGTVVLLRDVADVKPDVMPGEFDRYNMRRMVSMTANIEGEDLGHTVSRLDAAVRSAGRPPTNVEVDVRGQITPMKELFGPLAFQPPWRVPLRDWNKGLTGGLLIAIAIIFLLLTAYFQSLRLALVAVSSVPAVVAGIALTLWATDTTFNLQSFMGSIMAVGVSVSNAILLVTFAEGVRRGGGSSLEAAVEGVRGRVRPIVMTGSAMIAGMLPMALGEGGEQTAPLGRAVIGGLAASMVATLFVLPALFALFLGRASAKSPSLDPLDRNSPLFVAHYEQHLDDHPR